VKGFKELPSTSDYIKEHVNELDNFDSVYTDTQTKGRGRTGHTWESEPGKNAAFSILIKDKDIVAKYNLISIVTGIAVAAYLENVGIDNVQLKWPNDVLVNGKKICGILLEGSIPNYLIVGIGINVNQTKFEGFEATSLKNIIEIKLQPSLVAVDVCNLVLDYINQLGNDLGSFIDDYSNWDYLLNKEISFTYKGESLKGQASGINPDGSLRIKYNNEIINVTSDEVSLVRTIK